ncbi:MAG: hypothetical protein EOO61_03750 [Hymenobacter sp.]|nr:MAG: hypothetical protein EOO61_03750 [Hymenobacter sp.]
MDIITLEEYKSFFGMNKDNPSEDARINLLIQSVSSLIQTYLGLDFEGGRAVHEVITVDYDTNKIFLEHYPIAGDVVVTETDRYTTDSTVHVPLYYASDYVVDNEQGILTRIYHPGGFASWPVAPSVIMVDYVTAPKWAGDFGATGIPADLKLAALQLVSYYKNEEFRQSKTIQGSTVVNTLAKGSDFPLHIQVILDRYK